MYFCRDHKGVDHDGKSALLCDQCAPGKYMRYNVLLNVSLLNVIVSAKCCKNCCVHMLQQ